MTSTAVVRYRAGYLCNYLANTDATNLAAALCRAGIPTEVRPVVTPGFSAPERHYSYPESSTYSVWVCNEVDLPKAREFKRGLLATLSITGDPAAFVDGIVFGAKMRSQSALPEKLAAPLRKLRLGDGK